MAGLPPLNYESKDPERIQTASWLVGSAPGDVSGVLTIPQSPGPLSFLVSTVAPTALPTVSAQATSEFATLLAGVSPADM